MTSTEQVSWRTVFASPDRGIFITLCFGVWLHAADSTVVATLLPSVVAEVGGEALISWNFVLYRLAAIAAAVTGAIVARQIGLRNAMVLAALIVGVGCAVSALAPDMIWMLVGRTLQGVGGGMLVAMTTISVSMLFPSSFTPRVMAAISAVWGSSAFAGPLIGGIFAEFGEWRLGFWAFVVQSLILAAALAWALPKDTKAEKTEARIPWRRLGVLSVGVMSIAIAALEKDNFGLVALLCAIGVIGIALFLRLDRRAGEADRLLPRAIANPTVPTGVGLISIFLVAFGSIAFTVYAPVLLNVIHGIGPLAAGYLIALESVSWTIGALVFAGMRGETQLRAIRFAFIGFPVALIGFALFVASGPVWAIMPFLFLEGLAFGTVFGHVLQRCVNAAPPEDKDRTAGAITTVQAIGYTIGAAVAGLIANSVGFGDAGTLETAELAAVWIFIGMIPVASLGALLIWRLR